MLIFEKKRFINYLEKRNIFPSQIKKEKFLFIPILIDENKNDIFFIRIMKFYNNWNKI